MKDLTIEEKAKRYNAIEKFFLEQMNKAYDDALYDGEEPTEAIEDVMAGFDYCMHRELMLMFDMIAEENFPRYISSRQARFKSDKMVEALKRIDNELGV